MALLAVNVKGVFHPAARFNVHLNHALLDLAAFIDPVRHLVAVEVIGPRKNPAATPNTTSPTHACTEFFSVQLTSSQTQPKIPCQWHPPPTQ
jgi:hypothetical protein